MTSRPPESLRCRYVLAGLLVLVAAGCTKTDGGPIEVSSLRVFAPVPGTTTGVAYFKVKNPGAVPITLLSVSSPQFERVEIHETVINDGVASMQFLRSVEIDAGVEFTDGGKHIMLMQPVGKAGVGDPVELRLKFADERLVVLSAVLLSRVRD